MGARCACFRLSRKCNLLRAKARGRRSMRGYAVGRGAAYRHRMCAPRSIWNREVHPPRLGPGIETLPLNAAHMPGTRLQHGR
eukprot:scaffold14781_cov113-Isochrysis_galbana.AAC.6